MCRDFNGYHSGGSSFVYVNDFGYYKNYLYTHRYKLNSEKKKTGKESQYMVSHPETGLDSPSGSDKESGHDRHAILSCKKKLHACMRRHSTCPMYRVNLRPTTQCKCQWEINTESIPTPITRSVVYVIFI